MPRFQGPLVIVAVASLGCPSCGRTAEEAPTGAHGDAGPTVPPHAPAIFANGSTSCALDSSGIPTCWGDATDGAFHPPGGLALKDLAIGFGQICGLLGDATLACWGSPNKAIAPTPPPAKFSQMALGNWHACGLDPEGHILCWGKPISKPGGPGAPPGVYTQLSGSASHYCALRKSDGFPICWGLNLSGQASPPSERLTRVSAGNLMTCGLRPDRTALCWGVPVAVPAGTLRAVVAGDSAVCFVHDDASVSCAQVSLAPPGAPITQPPAGPFAEVAVGNNHACGVRPDGTVECWGDNEYGAATPPAGFNAGKAPSP